MSVGAQKLKITNYEVYELNGNLHYKLHCSLYNNTKDTIILPLPEEKLVYNKFQNINDFYKIKVEPESSLKKYEQVPLPMYLEEEKKIYENIQIIPPKKKIEFVFKTENFLENFYEFSRTNLPKRLYLIYDSNNSYLNTFYKIDSNKGNIDFYNKPIKSKSIKIK